MVSSQYSYMIFLSLLTAVIFTVAYTPGAHSSDNDRNIDYDKQAADILAGASRSIVDIYNRKREIFLSLTTKGRGYNVVNHTPLKLEIEQDYHKLVYTLAANLSVVPVDKLSDPLLLRRVQRSAKLQLYGLNKVDYTLAKELIHTMQTFITMRSVCHVRHAEDCQQSVAMLPHIYTHAIRSKKLEELKYYWVKWRQAINEKNTAKSSFIDYVRLWRMAAAYNGHVTPSRTWYLYYDTDNFQQELKDVMTELMPLYRELHAYLRFSAIKSYGNRLTANDGCIPAPVMEQMLYQAWFPRHVFRTPFPKFELPSVHQRLEEILVTPVKINKKAAEFFESLGLQPMSEGFYEKFSRRINEEEIGAECKSEVYYFPPDVALRYCPKLDYKKLLQMHGHMAELQYNLYKKELPFGLDREPCPGFGSAMGEAVVIASGTARHLFRLHVLVNDSLSDEQSLNKLFRMGVHTLLAIPQHFINDQFLVDVMDGRIEVNDYNCAYWRMQSSFAGVEPPDRRNEKHFDPDFKFYRGLQPEKSSTMKLISEILGFQFYRSFCIVSQQYKPGDPNFPLHNCDFFGSKGTGDMLKNMMQLGATKHWRDVMEIATGERKLSGRGIIEYFAPLFTWLKEQNKLLGLSPTWDCNIKCVNE